jgi:hypothetical protein
MEKMTTKQALEIIKLVLDQATEKGIFKNINDSFAVINAYNIISEKITSDESNAVPE